MTSREGTTLDLDQYATALIEQLQQLLFRTGFPDLAVALAPRPDKVAPADEKWRANVPNYVVEQLDDLAGFLERDGATSTSKVREIISQFRAAHIPHFHLYFFDANGQVAKRVNLVGCENDDQARGVAEAYPYGGKLELWEGNRRIDMRGLERSVRPARISPSLVNMASYTMDKDLCFVAANATALRYWGKSISAVIGRSLGEAFPNAIGSRPYEAHLRVMQTLRPFDGVVLSSVLSEAIELEIHPLESGLRASFVKLREITVVVP